ncbi:hypothetical protein V7S43_012989 [Phytophthora oleae]|uniref:Uncharacterized protein n=1 Tax=Phytophthora oleae TaxID=2107226 RepID=A0ABD3F5Q6_9STRA
MAAQSNRRVRYQLWRSTDTVRWLMEKYLPVETVDNVAEIAATLGQLGILQWLNSHQRDRVGFDGTLCGLRSALENRHEHVMWLREHVELRAESRNNVLRSAVKGGTWILSGGCVVTMD